MAKADKVDKANRPTTKDKKAPPAKLPKTSTEILASAAAENKEKVSPPPKKKDMKPSKGVVAKAEPKTRPKAQSKTQPKTQPKIQPKTQPGEASSSDESTESSFDEKPKAAQVKAAPTKAEAASSSESDSSDDEDDSPIRKISSPVSRPKHPTRSSRGKEQISDKDDSSNESDSEEESSDSSAEESDAKAEKKAKSSSGEDGSSDSESESDEEPVKAKPPTKNAALSSPDKASPKTKSFFAKAELSGEEASDGSEEESSESPSDEESDEDEDGDVKMSGAAVAATTGGKRKAVDESPPVKKVKLANGHAAPAGQKAEETKSIFVGRLSWSVDNDRLAEEFASCGEVVSATVAMDRNTGKSRGFGHVNFAAASAVEKALEMNGKEIDGRPINVDRSTPQEKSQGRENRARAFGDTTSPPSGTLFIGNLSFNTTEDGVWSFFNDYEVKSVRLPTDRETGRPKGFGYVEFEDVEGAKKAFEASKGAEIDGRSIRVDFSQPRDGPGGGGRSDRGGWGQPRGRGRGGDRGGWGGDRGGRGGDRGGRGGDRGGRGGDRGGRGGRGGWRGGSRGGNARSGGIAAFEGRKTTF